MAGGPALACAAYQPQEARASRTTGLLPEPVVRLAPNRLLLADFPVDEKEVPARVAAHPLYLELQRKLQPGPDTGCGASVDVVGYSDCAGEVDTNVALRQGRAAAVETELDPRPASQVAFRGMAALGQYVATNDTPEGRARNRGVVVEERAPGGPADLLACRYDVVVVGSPGPAEVKKGHTFQFADAASRLGGGARRVWLVERTGYELGGADLAGIEARAQGAQVFWVTPERPLASVLNTFPPASVASLNVYSHGVPGTVTLRFGWPGQADYGLTRGDARTLAPAVFVPGATLRFDSCNTATDPSLFPGIPDEDVSLAQAVANRTGLPVEAWVGRTSYRLVNRGAGGVVGSEIWPEDSGFDKTELYSSVLRQRTPRRVYTAPQHATGGFSSWFKMSARLPATRDFPVPEGGVVEVTIAATSEHEPMQGARITVLLHRRTAEWYRSDETLTTQEVVVGGSSTLSWQSLAAGTYYLELFHLSGLTVEGTITVNVR